MLKSQVKQDLISSGFVPKVEKSLWRPIRTLTFLGYFIDTKKGLLSIPGDRLDKLYDTIVVIEQTLTRLNRVRVRTIASLVGQVISMSYVVY